MPTSPNRLIKLGALMFILWGILHIVVGAVAVVAYATKGPIGIFTAYGATLESQDTGHTLMLAANIALEFSIILAGYGILSIWAAIVMYRGQVLGFWLNTVLLGIVDAAFVYALMMPGYIPLDQGIWGPVLYVAGVILSAIGLQRPSTS
jgi:hypothetical protein